MINGCSIMCRKPSSCMSSFSKIGSAVYLSHRRNIFQGFMFVGYINCIDAFYMIIGNINKKMLRHSQLMQR